MFGGVLLRVEVAVAAEAWLVGAHQLDVLAGPHADAEFRFGAGLVEVEGEDQVAAHEGQQAVIFVHHAVEGLPAVPFLMPGHEVEELGAVPARQRGVERGLVFGEMPLPVAVFGVVEPFGVAEFRAHEVQPAGVRRVQRNGAHQAVQRHAACFVPCGVEGAHARVHGVAYEPPDHGVVAVDALVVTFHVAYGAVIDAVICHLIPQFLHGIRGLDELGPEVRDAHGKAVVEAEAAFQRRTGEARHTAEFLRDADGFGPHLVDERVRKAEVELAVHVGAGLAVLAVETAAHVAEVVADAVVEVEHIAHGVEAEAVHAVVFHPVAAVGEQEAARHFLGVIEARRAPLVRFLVENVAAGVVVGDALFGVGAGVAVGDVEDDGYAEAVGFVHEALEVVGRAVARAGREVAAHLIAEGLVERMLQNAHELNGGVAAFGNALEGFFGEFVIGSHSAIFAVAGIDGHAYVGLVDAREAERGGRFVLEEVGFGWIPEAGAPLVRVFWILFDPFGKGGHAAQNVRAFALQTNLEVVAVGEGLAREVELPEAVGHAHELVVLAKLEVDAAGGQPHVGSRGHMLGDAPYGAAVSVHLGMHAELFMQRSVGRKRAPAAGDAGVFLLEVPGAEAQEGLIFGKRAVLEGIVHACSLVAVRRLPFGESIARTPHDAQAPFGSAGPWPEAPF